MIPMSIWIGLILAKAFGVPVVKELKWSHVTVLPAVFMLVVACVRVLGWVFGPVFALIGLDAMLWVLSKIGFTGMEWEFQTWMLIKTALDAL